MRTLYTKQSLSVAMFALLTVACDGIGFAPAVEICDVLNDSGCPEGQMCVGLDEQQCVIAGQGNHGDACKTDADCKPKHLCTGGSDGNLCRRRCDLTVADSCGAIASEQGRPELKDAICLWATPAGLFNLGFCTAPQCEPASNEGCEPDELCVGGLEPQCKSLDDQGKVTRDDKTVTYPYGKQALGATCEGPGHCQAGGVCATSKGDDGVVQRRCLQACKTDGDTSQGAAGQACGAGYLCKALEYTPQGRKQAKPMPAQQGYCVREYCHTLTNEGCPTGKKCVGSAKPSCADPGNVGLMDKCSKLADCDISTTCVSGGRSTLCVQKCDVSGALPDFLCPDHLKCYALLTIEGKPKPDNLGFCGPK